MAASYPSSVKSFPAKADGDLIVVTFVTDLEAEVVAMETALLGTFTLGNTSVSGTMVTSRGLAVSLVAGETVSARDAVYVSPTLTAGTAGRVY